MSTPSQSGPDLPVGDAGAGRSARLRVGVAALAAICAGVVVMLLGHPALAPLSLRGRLAGHPLVDALERDHRRERSR